MVAKLAEAEQLKRSFLMSVSHELRTPLTAIRGHVEALREGIVAEPEQVLRVARHRRGRDRPARAARRRRPRSREAPGPPLHGAPRGGRPRAGPRSGIRCVHRGGAPTRDRLPPLGRRGRARDRLGRRSRAPGDHEPPLERVSLDARRWTHRAPARAANGPGRRRRARHRPRCAAVAASADLRGVRLARTRTGRASGFRSRASSRWRSAAGSSSSSDGGTGSRFRLVLPVLPSRR